MNNISVSELLNLIDSCYFAGTKEIRMIGCIGENRALEIKRMIKNKIMKEGNQYILPKNKVPMCEVMNFFGIDIDYLKKIKERENTNG